MPNTSVKTCYGSSRYGDLPSELPKGDLLTYRQVIQYSYLIKKTCLKGLILALQKLSIYYLKGSHRSDQSLGCF